MSLSADKQALVALRRLRARVEELERQRTEPIAVIGIGCRFPGGVSNPDTYWQLLQDGVDAISEVPADRWDVDAYYDADPDAPGKMHTRHGGFVRDIDRFDPQFFGIAPREAIKMDPQQRLLLEAGWEALEHAGQAPDTLAGSRTGVFLGLSSNDYVQLLREASPDDLDAYNLTGNAANFAAGRISYLLGLQGPSLTIDTACSSSLVAVHLACQSLRAGESRMALAGGANAILVPDHNVLLSKARMLAPDGRCKTFDKAADGYVRGEGCGVIVLKRLSDAEADGDRVLAVIRGTAVNQDGRSSGLTVPNGPAQEALIRAAIEASHVDAHDVAYVEAHGSGTSLGDPIEIRALNAALCNGRPADRRLLVGSAKTNLGHLEAAAGIAGVIKVVLALQHGEIPAHLHVRDPNPHIPWQEIPVAIARERIAWPSSFDRRVAGVSSFGASGTNAHVVVEQAPAPVRTEAAARPQVIALSARTADSLRDIAGRWSRDIRTDGTRSLADLAFTANAGRAHFSHRLALTVTSLDEAAEKLDAFAAGRTPAGAAAGEVDPAVRPKVAFLFTGQGAQYAGMGRELYETEPLFRRAFDRVDEVCSRSLERPLREVLYGAPEDAALVDRTGFTQPALFALEFALAELVRSWGLEPTAVLGHSIGGYTAACVAGTVRVDDAAALVAARGRLMQGLPAGGGMAAVFADERTVQAAIAPLADVLAIAAVNGDDSIVISGAQQALDAAAAQLSSRGVRVQPLRVSHAFHSPLMDPIREEFERVAAGISFEPPHIACISDVTGEVLKSGDISAAYWSRHLRQPVRFAAALDAAYARGCRVFVELGPSPTLSTLGRRRLPEDAIWVPTLRQNRRDLQQMVECLRDLYVAGVQIDWPRVGPAEGRRKVSAPTYPFRRERFWVDTKRAVTRPDAAWRNWLYDLEWRRRPSAGSTTMPLDMPPAPALARRAASEVDALAERHGMHSYWAMQPKLHTLCASYVQRAFVELGWDLDREPRMTAEALRRRAGVLDRHVRLFGRMFEILAEEGMLRRERDGWTVVAVPAAIDADAESRRLLDEHPEYGAEIALAARCARELAGVLCGRTNPMELLFPQGSLDQLERVYQDAPGSRVFNSLLRTTIEAALAELPARRHIRVLEIGAGTGSTAAYLLPALNPDRARYTFTDLSNAFLARAREKFNAYGFVEYRLLDISQPSANQGFEPGSFDVIVASHVLHATPDLRKTVANVSNLLAPGGLLMLLESTAATRFLDLTFGMTDGWWNFTDADVRSSSALADAATWRQLLGAAGFTETAVAGDLIQGHRTDAAVIVARRDPSAHAAPTSAAGAGQWLVLADTGGAGEALADLVRQRGGRAVVADGGAEFARLADDRYSIDPLCREDMDRLVRSTIAADPASWRGVVHFWGADASLSAASSSEDVDRVEQRACGSVLHLAQALAASGITPLPRLTAVTRGAQPVGGHNTNVEPAQAMVWGLGRVLTREHPELRFRCVDLDPRPAADEIEALYEDVLADSSDESEMALRGGERLVLRLAPAASLQADMRPGSDIFRGDGAYLVTGGLGGVGLLVAEHMVAGGARRLVLMGRSEPSEATARVIRSMEAAGARVDVVRASVASREAISGIVRRLAAEGTPLRGVMHSAGTLDDGVLGHQSWDRFRTVMEAKVHGAWNLHLETERLPLDFFVLFSTSAAVLGPAGQSNHAAANAFMDALAHHRRSLGLAALSVNWGPWRDVGAAARAGAAERGEAQGLGSIDPQGGLRVLDHLITAGAAQAAVMNADWSRMLAPSVGSRPPLVRDLDVTREATPAPAHPAQRPLRQELAEAPALKKWPLLLAHVAEQAGRVLGLDAAELGPRQGLRDLGLDSLMALELRNRLQRSMDAPLRSTLAFDFPTIDAIARHLAADVLHIDMEGPAPPEPPAAADSGNASDLLMEIENLSDDEVDKLFALRAAGPGA